LGSLVEAFNMMAAELGTSQTKLEQSREALERTNIEVDARRRYIETVLERVATGVYRVTPSPFRFLWIAANELPLADELIPFLIARSGRPLDAFVGWVKTRRPIEWLLRVLAYLPMSTAAHEDLRSYVFPKTDDPVVRARQRMIAEWAVESSPEMRDKLVGEGRIEGRTEGPDRGADRGGALQPPSCACAAQARAIR